MPAPATCNRATTDWIAETRLQIDAHLDSLLGPAQPSPVLEAMRYSVLAPGKRIRPLLTLAVANFLGYPSSKAMHVACAIELVHCASLILDDLPCMDDDRERRSRLSTHIEFGENLTILAAVSLLTQSQCIIVSDEALDMRTRLTLVRLVCDTVGPSGLSLGQYIDLTSKTDTPGPATITGIHHLKTGVLFLAAAKAGCLICNASAEQEEKVMHFTNNLGLAFQLLDDLKDVGEAGPNMVTHIGVSNVEHKIRQYLQAAGNAVKGEPNAKVLQNLAQVLIKKI